MFFTVAVGYVKTRHDRIEMDPDLRIREAISLVFRKFAEFQSIRQVHLWLRQERIQLPAADGPRTVWKLPVYNTVHHMLTNPVYGGAYAFGRTGSRVTVRDGRKRVTSGCRRARADWEVLIPEHHEGYISWAEFERNQQLIADNANSKGFMARGAVRRGESLLAGLLRCGHCGRRLHVAYSGTDGFCGRYNCRGAHLNHGTEPCISFGGIRVDAAVAAEVLRVLASLGIKAALRAIEARRSDAAERRRQTELALTQARYEAELARRQYDRIDPDNRLVAAELERRWNDRLVEVCRLEEQLSAPESDQAAPPRAEERARLLALGADIEALWHHPGATAETRKRIVRTVIAEIVVKLVEDTIQLVIHWQGGDHTRLTVPRNRQTSLEHRGRDGRSDPGSGPATAGQRHRGSPEPGRQAHRQRQHLDRGPGAQLSQRPWHRCLPGRRDGGARRVDSGANGGAPEGQQDDGAEADRRRRSPGVAGVQGGAVGDCRGPVVRAGCRQAAVSPPGTRQSGSADP